MTRGIASIKLELHTQYGPLFVSNIDALILNRTSELNVARDAPHIHKGAVVTTGGSRGTALAISQSFRSHGHKVHVLARIRTTKGNTAVDLLDSNSLEHVAGKIEESHSRH